METGELYLFHTSDATCPAATSLWGVIDREHNGLIYLESSSRNLRDFRLWHPLPHGYRHHRLASRSELRDYITAQTRFELQQPPRGQRFPHTK